MNAKGPPENTGSYAITIDEARRLVRVEVIGLVDANIAMPMVTDARAAAMPRGFNILYDFMRATPGKIGSGDVFWFPRNIPALATKDAGLIRIAALHPPQAREIMRFWETSFRNMGLKARAFEEEPAALAWLAKHG